MAKRRKRERRERGSGYITPLAGGRAKAHYPKPGGGYFVKRCDSEADAERWLEDLAKREAAQYDLVGGQQSFGAWVARWLLLLETDTDDPPKLRTIEDYRFKLGYPNALLGDMVLADIKPDHVDNALRLIRKNLAQNTTNQIRNLLWRVMDDAVTREYIPRNPVRKARRSKRARRDDKRQEVYRLSIPQAVTLLRVLATRPEALAWWLVILLGLREGEVLGLKRDDIDLVHCTIRIDEQYTQLNGRAHHSTTKTPHSDRLLPFPRQLVPVFELLFRALDIRAAKAIRRGTWQEHQLLFPGKSGRPMNPSSLCHMLKRMLPVADLPGHVNVHHLRHTAAKFYADLLAPDNVRAALAGHSPKSIDDHYGRADVQSMRPWVEQVYTLLSDEAQARRKTA